MAKVANGTEFNVPVTTVVPGVVVVSTPVIVGKFWKLLAPVSASRDVSLAVTPAEVSAVAEPPCPTRLMPNLVLLKITLPRIELPGVEVAVPPEFEELVKI